MRSIGSVFAVRPCGRLPAFASRLPTRRCISNRNAAPNSIARLLDWKPDGEARDVVVNGFIRSVRSMKSRTFVALGDGSSLAPLQALVPKDQAEEGYGTINSPTLFVSVALIADTLSCAASPWAPLSASEALWCHLQAPARATSYTSRKCMFWAPRMQRCAHPCLLNTPATSNGYYVTDHLVSRHFPSRRNTKHQSISGRCHTFGREPPSTPLS